MVARVLSRRGPPRESRGGDVGRPGATPCSLFFPYEAQFPGRTHAIAQARRMIAEMLPGLEPATAEAVTLMVSELATNSVQYAGTDFTVTIERLPRRIRIAVTDAGPGEPVMRAPAATEPTGRGLRIVERLSDDWGVQHAGACGKTVWFTVRV
jgi:anti-sigma regulatory factor (Ser/Thr protein kinase)